MPLLFNFYCRLTVSSVQIEWTWVPNITEVKIRKRRPSKHRRMRRITVAGGENVLHSRGTKTGFLTLRKKEATRPYTIRTQQQLFND